MCGSPKIRGNFCGGHNKEHNLLGSIFRFVTISGRSAFSCSKFPGTLVDVSAGC